MKDTPLNKDITCENPVIQWAININFCTTGEKKLLFLI